MATGLRDTTSLVMLTGWDAAELHKFTLRDGTTYAAIVSELNRALAALNAELANDSLWAGLVSFTDQPDIEYRIGASNGMLQHTEYGRPDAKRADTEGHMLPLLKWDRMLGWTWDYLKDARLEQVQADLTDAIKDVRDRWRIQILSRLLKRGDDSGVHKGLGSSGYSPGFATTAAQTNVDYTPPANGGTTFASTHEHYVGSAGGAFVNGDFQDCRDELREHGHEPPFDLLIGPSDVTAVKALSDFTPADSPLLIPGLTADRARVSQDYIGTIHDFAVREVRGIPQYYGFAFKSYGPRSQRNPIRVRLEKGTRSPAFIAMPDPRAGNGLVPLQHLMVYGEFGVGVADRSAGTARYNNNVTWADGTAT
jgi:hypothetical protein